MTSEVTGITGITTAAPAAANAAKAQQHDPWGKDTFLKLLVAQLRYQDPSKPADPSQFLSQTAQFTVVERLQELATQNTELLAAQRTLQASTLIGRRVSFTAADGTPGTGTVDKVRMGPDGLVLHVGNTEVSLKSVTEIAAG